MLWDPVITWFAANARQLPWRTPERTAWEVLVSEVMLQQTPVSRVLPVWRAWVRRWPTPAALATASAGDAVRAWGRLGYPRRALRLHAASRLIVDRHDGVVPFELSALRALPGVGDYTAAAVHSFAYRGRAAVLDTNVRRVLTRSLAGQALPAPGRSAAESRFAEAALPPEQGEHGRAATWNAAVMELGALVCTARSPRCGACPIAHVCRWRLAGRPPYTGVTRKRQAWQGTDRQCRGRILALLREHDGPVGDTQARQCCGDADQVERCLAGLARDGLLVALPGGDWALPL